VERFITIFWLLLIPTQLGRHFWLNESSVMGARIDYLSVIFYATDIAWILWIWTQRKKIKINVDFLTLIIILMMVVNIIFSGARWVALYHWVRIWQWWLTWQLVSENKVKIIEYLKNIVPWWIVVESFLGLAQVVKGGSLNGIWWWLGERRFIFGGIGIAQIRLFDEGWIRAYGTFSHPNSLAGFLLLAWWWWRTNLPSTPFFDKTGGKYFSLRRIFYWVVNWSAMLGIILTGSRVVWLLTLGLLIAEQFKPTLPSLDKEGKKKYLRRLMGTLFLFGGVICLVLGVVSINYRISDFVGGWDIQSWQKRENLAVAAVRMIEKTPLFGVGAGNFMVNLPKFQRGGFYWMQPVHNIILLTWSEIGALGLIIFLILGINRLKKFKWRKQVWFLVIVGVTGMLDHYWVTLPQNAWLLAIILGVI
jgi:hypothetical protein